MMASKLSTCILYSIVTLWLLLWNPLYSSSVSHAAESRKHLNNTSSSEVSHRETDIRSFSKEKIHKIDSTAIYSWQFAKKYEFSKTLLPEVTVMMKKSASSDNPLSKKTSASNKPLIQYQTIDLKQKFNDLTLGAEYRYHQETDEQGMRILLNNEMGLFNLETSLSRLCDNLNYDPYQSPIHTTQGDIAVDYNASFLPLVLSLSYSQGLSESEMKSSSLEAQKSIEQTYEVSLHYSWGNAFGLTASSNYSSIEDQAEVNGDKQVFSHEVIASIQPYQNVDITSAASYTINNYEGLEERTEESYASLSISYDQLFSTVDLSLSGSYSEIRDTRGYQDERIVKTSASINWNPNYLSNQEMSLFFKLGYDTYTDKIYPDYSYDSFSTYLGLEISL